MGGEGDGGGEGGAAGITLEFPPPPPLDSYSPSLCPSSPPPATRTWILSDFAAIAPGVSFCTLGRSAPLSQIPSFASAVGFSNRTTLISLGAGSYCWVNSLRVLATLELPPPPRAAAAADGGGAGAPPFGNAGALASAAVGFSSPLAAGGEGAGGAAGSAAGLGAAFGGPAAGFDPTALAQESGAIGGHRDECLAAEIVEWAKKHVGPQSRSEGGVQSKRLGPSRKRPPGARFKIPQQ